MTTWTQEAMVPPPATPELPDPLDLSRGPDGEPLGGDAKWTTYKGSHRPCDWCIRAIHQQVMRSHPLPARHKRAGPTSEPAFLCTVHGGRQLTRDQMVKRHLEGIRNSQKKRRP
jgi:hypothetical protein